MEGQQADMNSEIVIQISFKMILVLTFLIMFIGIDHSEVHKILANIKDIKRVPVHFQEFCGKVIGCKVITTYYSR